MIPQLTCFKGIKALLLSENLYSIQGMLEVLCEEVHALWYLGNLLLALRLPLVALSYKIRRRNII